MRELVTPLFILFGSLVVLASAQAQPASQPASRPAGSTQPAASRPASPRARQLEVVYTGGTGGLGSYSSTGSTILLLWDELTERGGSNKIEQSGLGVLRRGKRLLFDPERIRAGTLKVFLKAPAPKTRVLADKLPVLESDHVMLFQYPPDPDFDLLTLMERRNQRVHEDLSLRRRTATLLSQRSSSGRQVFRLELDGADGSELETDPLAWEFYWGVSGKARLGEREATYYMIMKPYGVGARRVQHIKKLTRGSADRTLLVSAGNDMSTLSHISGEKSPVRELDLRTMAKLGYHALLPGNEELYFGLEQLEKEAAHHKLPLVATNLFHKSGKDKGRPVFHRYLLRRINGVQVGIIGLVSKRVLERVQDPKLLEGVEIRDPVASAVEAITEMRKLPRARPDLVLALSTLRGEEHYKARTEVYGVDLLISQQYRWSTYSANKRVSAAKRFKERLHGRKPLLLACAHSHLVGQISVELDEREGRLYPQEIEDRPEVMGPELPLDREVHRRITALGMRDLARMESELMPSLEAAIGESKELMDRVRADPEFTHFLPKEQTKGWQQLWYTGRLWSNVVANILRRCAAAEVSLVRKVRQLPTSIPGPVLESYVLRWLDSEETVHLYELTGEQLEQVARAAADKATISGLDPEASKVAGRSLSRTERYRVVMASSMAKREAVAKVLSGLEPVTRFSLAGDRIEEDSDGKPARIRDIVLASLRGLREQHPKLGEGFRQQVREWLTPKGSEVEPRWSIAAEGLTFSFSNYSNYPKDSYLKHPNVRETRVVMPNNYTLGIAGTLRAAYDSADLNWSNQVKFQLARTVIDLEELEKDLGAETVEQETADDLVVSTELQLKYLQLSMGRRGSLKLVPYVNASFDTEFTPTKHIITKQPYRHQKELYGSAGLVLNPGQIWQEIRLAGLTRTDFAADKGQFEAGLLVGTGVEVPLWRASLGLGATLRYFPSTSSDTEEDLGLILEGSATLKVPFTRDLSVTLGADLLLYRPKIRQIVQITKDENDQEQRVTIDRDTAVSLILSAGVTFDHLWKL